MKILCYIGVFEISVLIMIAHYYVLKMIAHYYVLKMIAHCIKLLDYLAWTFTRFNGKVISVVFGSQFGWNWFCWSITLNYCVGSMVECHRCHAGLCHTKTIQNSYLNIANNKVFFCDHYYLYYYIKTNYILICTGKPLLCLCFIICQHLQ